jgi:hypothetical protein
MEGALAMGAALRCKWRVVIPPAKDLRAWVSAGAARSDFDAVASFATWR